jgi:hypothetical protein
MRIPLIAIAMTAIAATLVGVSACGTDSKTSTPSSGSSTAAHPAISDYTTLLIKAGDINAPDPFTAGPPTKDPNLPDIEAAANALESAKATHRETLQAKSLNAEVGVGGSTVSGLSPDHSKGVTVLVFTEGKAMVTLRFEGPSFALAPPEFVTDVGQKQDEAIKRGLGS